MTEVIEGIHFIQGQDESIPDAHAYVIGKSSSNDLSLIDPGLMGKGGYKLGAIQEAGIKLEDIKRVIMTHIHLDHIGCLGEVKERMPWIELWVHTLEANDLEQGDERGIYGMEMFKEMAQGQYGLKDGDFSFQVDRKLQEGEKLEIGGMSWEVLHIPGHSAGSIGLYGAGEKTLIPGDVVYADNAIGRFDLHNASGPQHRSSLMRLGELDVDILLPGHNRIVTKLPPGYILETAEQWAPHLG
ncbi:MAG: MBL fold metallo-hydrolase [Deltaproteobacteria bacterium]|nr:MBL fold metallo-hydrolase [Deltaproteobacteria bacterium]